MATMALTVMKGSGGVASRAVAGEAAATVARHVRCLTTRTTASLSDVELRNSWYANKASETGVVTDGVAEGVTDYSRFHEPVGRLLTALPRSQKEAQPYALNREQVALYWESGYVGNVPVLSEEQCDLLLEELTSLVDPQHPHPGHGYFHEYHANQTDDPNNVLLHALGHWRITPGFHDLIFMPNITIPSSQLLQETVAHAPVRFWHDQLFCKPAHHGGNVAWHQDYSYWTRTKPMQHLTVHVALEDQTPDNGAIMYVPKSHHWTRDGLPLPITADDFKDMESIKTVLTPEELAQWEPVHCCLKKGEAVFHHPLAVHGSYGNRSKSARRAAVVNYFADGTRCDTDDALLAQVPPIPRGEQLQLSARKSWNAPEQISSSNTFP